MGRTRKRRVADLPAGAERLVTGAVGLHGVWVNGQRAVDANGLTDDGPRAGRVLREFAR